MAVRDLEFEPIDYYNKVLKTSIKENASKYFDDRLKDSKLSIEENQRLYNHYMKMCENDQENEKKISWVRFARMLVWVIFAFLIVILLLCVLFLSDNLIACILLCVGVVLSIILMVICLVKISDKLRQLKEVDVENDKKRQDAYSKLNDYNRPLKDQFFWNDFNKIVKNTTDIFTLDDNLDPKKLLMFRKVYNYLDTTDTNQSIVGVLSGNIETNPFIKIMFVSADNVEKTYTGSITISWVTYVSDGRGGRRAVTHSEVLTASVTKPAIEFSDNAYVIYGNNAAPKLSFSRCPSGLNSSSDASDIEKIYRSNYKKMQKMQDKALKEGGSFQVLANDKFEGLFGAFDRNNEIEYRLLFTPLAQNNMVDLITSTDIYPDCFTFIKKSKLNVITTYYSSKYPYYLIGFFIGEESFTKMKAEFIDTISNVFKNIYYELSPILSIPLYQQTEAGEFNLNDEIHHVSEFEAEAMVNQFGDYSNLIPVDCDTQTIRKIHFNKSVGDVDIYDVDCLGYQTVTHVEYVSKLGGDGNFHSVPVEWIEYVPVSKQMMMGVKNLKAETNKQANSIIFDLADGDFISEDSDDIVFNKNLLAFIYDQEYNEYDDDQDKKLSSVIAKYLDRKEN